jgi:hypothetical protein
MLIDRMFNSCTTTFVFLVVYVYGNFISYKSYHLIPRYPGLPEPALWHILKHS